MKREILLNHECIALAAQHGLGGLYELAQHLHMNKCIARGDAVIHLHGPDDATTARGFWFNPASGSGGILEATAGQSVDEDGLEGVRFLFNPEEAEAAQAALLSELRSTDAFQATRASGLAVV